MARFVAPAFWRTSRRPSIALSAEPNGFTLVERSAENELSRIPGLPVRFAARRRPVCGPGKEGSYERKAGPEAETSDGLPRYREGRY